MVKRDVRDLIDLVRRPLITEKATMLLEDNKYVFEVSQQARKPEIKEAIETLFDVKVVKVHTQAATRKSRRVGRFIGHKPMYKRAIVTLAEGDSIVLFPEVQSVKVFFNTTTPGIEERSIWKKAAVEGCQNRS